MPSGELYDNAVDKVSEAINFDKQRNFEMALKTYKKSLEMFLVVLKYERNPKSKEFLSMRIDQYMSRAEELEKLLQKPEPVMEQNNDDDDEVKSMMEHTIVKDDMDYSWDDIAGLDLAKQSLKEAVVLPMKFPSMFTNGRSPWKGILLFGCPGTGKTFLAKVVASVSNATFYSLSSSDIVSKWQGESEKAIKQLFTSARENKPSVIFFDEIESLCSSRNDSESESTKRIKTTLLIEMDGVGKSNDGVLVMGATNLPWMLDSAFRRRFQKRIYIPLPDSKARKYIINRFLSKIDHDLSEKEVNMIVEKTDGYSGSDINILLKDSDMEPIRILHNAKQFLREDLWKPCLKYPNCKNCPMNLSSNPSKGKQCDHCGAFCIELYDIEEDNFEIPKVTFEHILNSLKNTPSTISNAEVEKYVEWSKTFGQDGA
jgi:vacuolar protein-sorting-associated protein 4